MIDLINALPMLFCLIMAAVLAYRQQYEFLLFLLMALMLAPSQLAQVVVK